MWDEGINERQRELLEESMLEVKEWRLEHSKAAFKEIEDAHGPNKNAAVASSATVQLAKPANLNVTSLPLRNAELTWTNVPNAGEYVVEFQEVGGSWTTTYRRFFQTARFEIDLDALSPSIGFANATGFDIRVKARRTVGVNTPGIDEYSETIVIRDNPLLLEGGVPDGSNLISPGKGVELQWNQIPGVKEYTIKYRKLGKSPRTGTPRRPSGNYHHTDTKWPNHNDWPYYGHAGEEKFAPSTLWAFVFRRITGLDEGEIYAFQINYETNNGNMVFSARDAYVYPSQDFPGKGLAPDRVATFPLFGHWPGKEYVYSICDDTFPSGRRSDWKALIKHAFEQWESSTNLVKMTPSDETLVPVPCVIDRNAPLTMILSIMNDVNEVFMVDTNDGSLQGWHLLNNLLFRCVHEAPACVISEAYTKNREASRKLVDHPVDVLINQRHSKFDPARRSLSIPGRDAIHSADDVKFNTCMSSSNVAVDFAIYETMVHEAGHTLGLSGFNPLSLPSKPGRYEMAHPTIKGSVMNYREYTIEEPDCSPHPFDIMAVYALYQTVK